MTLRWMALSTLVRKGTYGQGCGYITTQGRLLSWRLCHAQVLVQETTKRCVLFYQ